MANKPGSHSGKKRVLVVDDHDTVIDSVIKILEKNKKYKIETAKNGLRAYLQIDNFFPELVILDIGISFINGLDICREIKKKDDSIKVLAMSGNSGEEIRREALEAGAEDFIEKPFTSSELEERVRQLLE